MHFFLLTKKLQLETPLGNTSVLPLQIIDFDQFGVHIHTIHEGLHKVHINCNSIALSQSPYSFMVQLNETKRKYILFLIKIEIKNNFHFYLLLFLVPIFESDVSKVKWYGPGLQNMILNSKNEFIIDASNAGNNILFVGICGPNGQCDEVSIKHCGNHIYNVYYQVKDPGMYMIIAKWGENHIPGSPFNLIAA